VATGGRFDDARRDAERMMRDVARFVSVIDVSTARQWGVGPLPGDGPEVAPGALRDAGAPRREVAVGRTAAELDVRFREDAPAPAAPAGVSDRVSAWKRRLLDLSLRNKLLNFKPSTRASLSLPFSPIADVEDRLAGGEALVLRPRPELRRVEIEADGLSPDRAAALRQEALRDLGGEQLAGGVLLADHLPDDAEARLLELYRASGASLAESGAVTLYLALGMLTWFEAPSSEVARKAPLVLVPVVLERPGRGAGPHRGAWRIAAAEEEEPRVNVTLLQKLASDFGLDTAGLDVPPADDRGLDVPLVLRRFRALVRDLPRWQVTEEAWLAQLSFAKFLMWLDLEAKTEALLANEVVAHLFQQDRGGAPPALAAPLVSERALERELPVGDALTVLDADPSQLQAVLAARDGSSFVLQGPPGTGKSQTITNLIARLLSDGRTVLFVSEKLAALEVVHRRLERVGLGPFCLELHSHQASRRAVVEQLKSAFAHANRQPPEAWEARARALDATRQALNDHADRLGAPSPFGGSVRSVLAGLFGLAEAEEIALPEVAPATLDAEAVARHRGLLRAVRLTLEEVGDPTTSPWRGCGLAAWSPTVAAEVGEALRGVLAAGPAAIAAAERLRAALSLPAGAHTPAAWDELDALAGLLRAGHAPPAALLDGGRARTAELRRWADHLDAVAVERAEVEASFTPAILRLDLERLRARFAAWATSLALFAWFALWGARRELRAALAPGAALPARAAVPEVLGRAAALRDRLAEVERWSEDARAWLGPAWEGADTPPARLRALADWADALRVSLLQLGEDPAAAAAVARVRALATEQAELAVGGGAVAAALAGFPEAVAAWREALRRLIAAASLDPERAVRPVAPPAGAPAAGLGSSSAAATGARGPSVPGWLAWAAQAEAALPALRPWCAAVAAADEAGAAGLGPLVEAALEGGLGVAAIERAGERSLRARWWAWHLEREPALARFRGADHRALSERFQALEEELLTLEAARVGAAVAARVPDLRAPGDELALLRRQMQLKSRHMPVRQLFRETRAVLHRVAPCALMSPLSVAQYLDPALPPYDVVVFDEASQIPPWDAVGAIARGRQVIVVGDSKQLPPTSFFDHGGDDDLADELDLEELESILDETVASGLPQLDLRWHYRSRHESLIAFSNHHYYDNRLHTFPSADHAPARRGVSFVHVPDGFYDRGRSRTNRAEAEAVVTELLRLLRLPDGARPSVGVVTFSQTQQRLVEDLVDAAFAAEPALERLRDAAQLEPVFVKNLENVQGDERDVMLFSIGYGPDAHGKVTMNFGPLNRKGGERRLNVAVTRARERLVVFSTLRADHIDLARTAAVGVAHLKAFLRYAEQGGVAVPDEPVAAAALTFESPFEEEVYEALTRAGHRVHTQVGASGYRIDQAVVDPDRPGAYVLAVECDGATYHGTATARARDRLRDAVLRGLGWRIHRVWSTDWWYEREAAERRLLAAVDEAIREARRAPLTQPTPTATADAGGSAQGARAARDETGDRTTPALSSRPSGGPEGRPPSAAGFAIPREVTPAAAPGRHDVPLAEPLDVDALLSSGEVGRVAVPSSWPSWAGLPAVRGGPKEVWDTPDGLRRLGADIVGVAAAGPVPADDVWREVAGAWGWASLGRRVVARLEEAVAALPPATRPLIQDGLVWPAGSRPSTWRAVRPSRPGDAVREASSLPVPEVAAAVAWVVGEGVSMSRDAAARATAEVFGISRMGRRIRDKMEEGIALAEARGWVVADGDRLRSV
jgi:very-short-patch-repair endonuclease